MRGYFYVFRGLRVTNNHLQASNELLSFFPSEINTVLKLWISSFFDLLGSTFWIELIWERKNYKHIPQIRNNNNSLLLSVDRLLTLTAFGNWSSKPPCLHLERIKVYKPNYKVEFFLSIHHYKKLLKIVILESNLT